jgi:hypothetical protein
MYTVDNKIIFTCVNDSEMRKLVVPNQYAKKQLTQLAEQKASLMIHSVKVSTQDETNAVIIIPTIQLRNLFIFCTA